MVVKKVGIWSAARILGAIYGVIGLLAGTIFAIISLVGSGIASATLGRNAPIAWPGLFFGVGAIVFLPLLYGVMGVIVGAISASLYNVFAKLLGGLELEVE